MSPGAAVVIDTDVAIVGGGPAGIAAAVRAAESGRRVMVLDEGASTGGQIWRSGPGTRAPRAARPWLRQLVRSGATTLGGASVIDARALGSGHGFALTVERGGAPFRVHATTLVLATGARERFLPFPGWTLPGVVGIGGAQALLKAGVSFAGQRVVIAGTGPLLLPVAASLAHAGARVTLVAEQTPAAAVAKFAVGLWRTPGTLVQAARYRRAFLRTRYAPGTWVTSAAGPDVVREITLTDGRRRWAEPCDVLCSGYGLVPNTEVPRLLGCAVSAGAVMVDEWQCTTVPGVYCAGEPTGIGGVDLALLEGQIAGLALAGSNARASAALRGKRVAARAQARRLDRAFALRDELKSLAAPDTIVCRCEDVPLGALRREWTPRQAKLYTRAGMGPCQGRVCGAALECLFGWESDAVRLPAQPALLSTLLADVAPPAAPPNSGA